MNAKTFRLLLLAAVLTVAALTTTPSYSYADPLCPTDSCFDVQNDCIVAGGNHDFFPYETTVGTCVNSVGDPFSLRYERCCRLPGCTEEIWVRYCYR